MSAPVKAIPLGDVVGDVVGAGAATLPDEVTVPPSLVQPV
jgi:hypothetical protein